MEAMSLVEVVLNHGSEEDHDRNPSLPPNAKQSTPIKGLDESVTITVTRTPGRPTNIRKQGGKPANFAMLSSPVRKRRSSDSSQSGSREDMICQGCQRVFKYKAAFMRHETQCGLPVAMKLERAAILEAKRAEKVAEIERRKLEEKREKLPDLRCPTCLKQFSDNDSFNNHNFDACAEERATYTFTCSVCQAKFKYKNHLRRHEDAHNNVRRFNCEVCTTAFLRPDHLKRHMMRMHGIVQLPAQNALEKPKPSPEPRAVPTPEVKSALSTTKNAPMQCPMCSKVLSRRDHLLRHIRNVHHVNYDSRKRGRSSDSLENFEGIAGQQGKNNTYHDDEDGSENLSMASDKLLIDESFESVKTECHSPLPDGSDQLLNKTVEASHGVAKSDFSYNQFSGGVRVKSEVSALNGDNRANSVMNQQSFGANQSVMPHLASMYDSGLVRPESGEKSGSSDGNQNVLSNGHGAQNAGNDWMSDLAGFSGCGDW